MTSTQWFNRARIVIPGGVNSPVRAFKDVGGTPVYFKEAVGSIITTEDNSKLVDFCNSFGPMILGHAHPEVTEEIKKAASKGTSYGANHRKEVEYAELLCDLIPDMDMIRFVNSGTEAVMTALRLARGYTGKNKIIKFAGGFHGHPDSTLIKSGSSLVSSGLASSAGISNSVASDVFIANYNDINSVKQIIDLHGDDIASIIVEPIAGNMGLVPPQGNFLEDLRKLTKKHSILLIFDEVINGFRLNLGTYGTLHGVKPDITTFGKILGGGLPIGAIGGTKEIMEYLAPIGTVYQSGTLCGNPLALTAGMKTIQILQDKQPYEHMNKIGIKIADGINAFAKSNNVKLHCAQLGSMFTPFFSNDPINNFEDAKNCDHEKYARFFHHMLNNGFYLPPSGYEVSFISIAHTETQIDDFLEAVHKYEF